MVIYKFSSNYIQNNTIFYPIFFAGKSLKQIINQAMQTNYLNAED